MTNLWAYITVAAELAYVTYSCRRVTIRLKRYTVFSPGQQNANNWRELMGKEACSPRNWRGNTAWQLFDGEGEGEEGEFERARRARALRVLARRNSPSPLISTFFHERSKIKCLTRPQLSYSLLDTAKFSLEFHLTRLRQKYPADDTNELLNIRQVSFSLERWISHCVQKTRETDWAKSDIRVKGKRSMRTVFFKGVLRVGPGVEMWLQALFLVFYDAKVREEHFMVDGNE